MGWGYLFIAGMFEVAWAIGLKMSQGFAHATAGVLTLAGMAASFYFLALALKSIPLGTAYAVWTGIGTVGTVLFGMILFKEPVSSLRLACILLIVGGIAGLKLLSR
ncbi:MAG: multidrug efflux SMR transporter [Alphaproteobacteria bacterium]|nr:multidrug efflux SMR transporter [Alphaproteobacteria bacterium]